MSEPENPTSPAEDAVEDETAAAEPAADKSYRPRHALPDDYEPESEVAAEDPEAEDPGAEPAPTSEKAWPRVVAFIVLPVLALLLAAGAGYLKWEDVRAADHARSSAEAVDAAKATTATILSYQPDTVEEQLTAARSKLTGRFLESYTTLTTDVVIPGAKQQRITASANVPEAAALSADSDRAEVLLMVNQSVSVGENAPSSTASSVKATMVKVGDQWLISDFTPV